MKGRKRARILKLVLSCLMVTFMLPVAALAADDVATVKNGTTITKNTTQEELDQWAGAGAATINLENGVTMIKLQKDLKLGKLGGSEVKATMPISFGTYPESQNDKMVLDLNGHLIVSDTMVIVSVCDLTIKDSVGSGKVFMDTSDSKGSAFGAVINQRKLTIESGSYEAKIHPDNSTVGVLGSAVANVETVVKGGTFVGSGSAVNVSSGKTIISGGNFEGASYGIVAKKDAVVEFPSGSTVQVTSTKYPVVVGKSGESTGKVNIAGGKFDGTNASALVGKIGDADVLQAVTIEGGSFTQDPVAYTGNIPVAQVGEPFIVGTEAIQEEVKAVNAGTTVTIMKGNVNLAGVPDGVTVSNKRGGEVSVNGEPVDPSESLTTHTHVWGEPEWIWSKDGKWATAKFTCEKDSGHTEEMAASVTSKVKKEATCTEKGITTYIAQVMFNGQEYTAAKDLSDIPVIKHQYVKGKCKVCNALDPNYKESGSNHSTKKENNKTVVPKTGDNSNIVAWLILVLASAVGVSAALVCKRKMRNIGR